MWNQEPELCTARTNLTAQTFQGSFTLKLIQQGGKSSQLQACVHTRTHTHRGLPVLLCRADLRPSIKVTAVKTGIGTDV